MKNNLNENLLNIFIFIFYYYLYLFEIVSVRTYLKFCGLIFFFTKSNQN